MPAIGDYRAELFSYEAMSERRRKFLQSLAPANLGSEPVVSVTTQPATPRDLPIVPVSSKSSSSKTDASRKNFFAQLAVVGGACGRTEEKQDPTPEQPQVAKQGGKVKFTIESLLSFQDTASGIILGKTAAESREPHRKRPNYNSSKRKLMATTQEREKHLDI